MRVKERGLFFVVVEELEREAKGRVSTSYVFDFGDQKPAPLEAKPGMCNPSFSLFAIPVGPTCFAAVVYFFLSGLSLTGPILNHNYMTQQGFITSLIEILILFYEGANCIMLCLLFREF